MLKRILFTGFVAVNLVACAPIKPYVAPPMPVGYDDPGPKPDLDKELPMILSVLRIALKDPYSLRDLVVCEPEIVPPLSPAHAQMKWLPSVWRIDYVYSAKNSYGAYTGRQHSYFQYRDGKNYFGGLLSHRSAGGTSCKSIPDTQVQSFMGQ